MLDHFFILKSFDAFDRWSIAAANYVNGYHGGSSPFGGLADCSMIGSVWKKRKVEKKLTAPFFNAFFPNLYDLTCLGLAFFCNIILLCMCVGRTFFFFFFYFFNWNRPRMVYSTDYHSIDDLRFDSTFFFSLILNFFHIWRFFTVILHSIDWSLGACIKFVIVNDPF